MPQWEWQPIETAPKDGSPLLLLSPEGDVGMGFIFAETFDGMALKNDPAAWYGTRPYNEKPSLWMGRYGAAEATHWMPLLVLERLVSGQRCREAGDDRS